MYHPVNSTDYNGRGSSEYGSRGVERWPDPRGYNNSGGSHTGRVCGKGESSGSYVGQQSGFNNNSQSHPNSRQRIPYKSGSGFLVGAPEDVKLLFEAIGGVEEILQTLSKEVQNTKGLETGAVSVPDVYRYVTDKSRNTQGITNQVKIDLTSAAREGVIRRIGHGGDQYVKLSDDKQPDASTVGGSKGNKQPEASKQTNAKKGEWGKRKTRPEISQPGGWGAEKRVEKVAAQKEAPKEANKIVVQGRRPEETESTKNQNRKPAEPTTSKRVTTDKVKATVKAADEVKTMVKNPKRPREGDKNKGEEKPDVNSTPPPPPPQEVVSAHGPIPPPPETEQTTEERIKGAQIMHMWSTITEGTVSLRVGNAKAQFRIFREVAGTAGFEVNGILTYSGVWVLNKRGGGNCAQCSVQNMMPWLVTYRGDSMDLTDAIAILKEAPNVKTEQAAIIAVRMSAKLSGRMEWPAAGGGWSVGQIIQTAIENCSAVIIVIQSRDGAQMIIATQSLTMTQLLGAGTSVDLPGLTVPVVMIDIAIKVDAGTGKRSVNQEQSVAHAETLFIPRAAVNPYDDVHEFGHAVGAAGMFRNRRVESLRAETARELGAKVQSELRRAVGWRINMQNGNERSCTDVLEPVWNMQVTMTNEETEGETDTIETTDSNIVTPVGTEAEGVESTVQSVEQDIATLLTQSNMNIAESNEGISEEQRNILKAVEHKLGQTLHDTEVHTMFNDKEMIPVWSVAPGQSNMVLDWIQGRTSSSMSREEMIEKLEQGLEISSNSVILWKGLVKETNPTEAEGRAHDLRDQGHTTVIVIVTNTTKPIHPVLYALEIATNSGLGVGGVSPTARDIKALIPLYAIYVGVIQEVMENRGEELTHFKQKHVITDKQERRETDKMVISYNERPPCKRLTCDCVSRTGKCGEYCCKNCEKGVECIRGEHNFPRDMLAQESGNEGISEVALEEDGVHVLTQHQNVGIARIEELEREADLHRSERAAWVRRIKNYKEAAETASKEKNTMEGRMNQANDKSVRITEEINDLEIKVEVLTTENQSLKEVDLESEEVAMMVQRELNIIMRGKEKDVARREIAQKVRKEQTIDDVRAIRTVIPDAPLTSAELVTELRRAVCRTDVEEPRSTVTEAIAHAITGKAQTQAYDSQRKLRLLTEDLEEMRRRLAQVQYVEGEEVNHWPEAHREQDSPMQTRVIEVHQEAQETRRYRLNNGCTVTSRELLPSCVRKVTSRSENREEQRVQQEHEVLVGAIQQAGMEIIEWLTDETSRRPNDAFLAVSTERISRALGQGPEELQRELVQLLQAKMRNETKCTVCGEENELVCAECAVQGMLRCAECGCRTTTHADEEKKMHCTGCVEKHCTSMREQWELEAINSYKAEATASSMGAVFWLASESSGEVKLVRRARTLSGGNKSNTKEPEDLFMTHSSESVNTLTLHTKEQIQAMCEGEEDGKGEYEIAADTAAVSRIMQYNPEETEEMTIIQQRAIEEYIILQGNEVYGSDRIVISLKPKGDYRRVEGVTIREQDQPKTGDELHGYRGETKNKFVRVKTVVVERVENEGRSLHTEDRSRDGERDESSGGSKWLEEGSSVGSRDGVIASVLREMDQPGTGGIAALIERAQSRLESRGNKSTKRGERTDDISATYMQSGVGEDYALQRGLGEYAESYRRDVEELPPVQNPLNEYNSPPPIEVYSPPRNNYEVLAPGQNVPNSSLSRSNEVEQSYQGPSQAPNNGTQQTGYREWQRSQETPNSGTPHRNQHTTTQQNQSTQQQQRQYEQNQGFQHPQNQGFQHHTPTPQSHSYTNMGGSPGQSQSKHSSMEEIVRIVKEVMPPVKEPPASGMVPITDGAADRKARKEFVQWVDALEGMTGETLLAALPAALLIKAITYNVTANYLSSRVRDEVERIENGSSSTAELPESLWNSIMGTDWRDRKVELRKAQYRTTALQEGQERATREYVTACYHALSKDDPVDAIAAIKRAQQFVLDAGYPTHAKYIAVWIRGVGESFNMRTKQGFWERNRKDAEEAFLATAAEYRIFVSGLVARTANNTYGRTEYAMYASWVRSHGTPTLIEELALLAQTTQENRSRPSSRSSDRAPTSRGSERPGSRSSERSRPGDRRNVNRDAGPTAAVVDTTENRERESEVYYGDRVEYPRSQTDYRSTRVDGVTVEAELGESYVSRASGRTYRMPKMLDYTSPDGMMQFPGQLRAFWKQFGIDVDSPDTKADITSGKRFDNVSPFDWTWEGSAPICQAVGTTSGPCWLHKPRGLNYEGGVFHAARCCTAEHAPTAESIENIFTKQDQRQISEMKDWDARRKYVEEETVLRVGRLSEEKKSKLIMSINEVMDELRTEIA